MSGDLAVAAALDGVVVEGLGVGELILGLANTPEPRAETAMSRQLGAEQLDFRGNVGHRDNERLQQSTAVSSKPRDFMPSVEWETLLFFAGMLVMIGALENTGVITQLAEDAARASGEDPLTATMVILFVSASSAESSTTFPRSLR